QSSSFLTAFGSAFGSSNTSLNLPDRKSSIGDSTLGWRKRDFGDITTHGIRNGMANCLLSMWKKLAGTVIFTTYMLYPAAICKKRSSLALECSGPWPSYPCGNNSTRPFILVHLV